MGSPQSMEVENFIDFWVPCFKQCMWLCVSVYIVKYIVNHSSSIVVLFFFFAQLQLIHSPINLVQDILTHNVSTTYTTLHLSNTLEHSLGENSLGSSAA